MKTDNSNISPISSSGERSLHVIASSCAAGSCPTVYRTDSGTVVVQGYEVSAQAAGVNLPAGELLVEIPIELLRTVAKEL